jgi:hypothetical protein
MTVRDENVEAVRAAREALVRKFSGLDGWFRHLQQRDRRRVARGGSCKRKTTATATKGTLRAGGQTLGS